MQKRKDQKTKFGNTEVQGIAEKKHYLKFILARWDGSSQHSEGLNQKGHWFGTSLCS